MVDIWSIGKGDVSKMRFLFYSILKKLLLAIEFTTTKRITSAAAALTYSTLLAIVPIFAVVFGIARGFGYNKYIEEWFRESFSSQPQVSEIIIGFVNSYLVHTKSGLFLGIGLLLLGLQEVPVGSHTAPGHILGSLQVTVSDSQLMLGLLSLLVDISDLAAPDHR